MPTPFPEDLSVFYRGESSEVVDIAGAEVWGNFDDPFATIEDFEGSQPTFTTATDWLPGGLVHGTPLTRTLTGDGYSIRGIRPSGNGVTVLQLQRSP